MKFRKRVNSNTYERSDMNEIEKIKIVSDLELNCILFQNDEVP